MSDSAPQTAAEEQNNIQPGYLGLSPPPGQLPSRGERLWVDRPEQLFHAVNTLKKASVVAIDAEFTQGRSRAQNPGTANIPRLAVLQLAIDRHCFIVDTRSLQDLSPLAAIIENPAIVVLLHGAGADIRVMAERGLRVVHYYDLEATCRSIFGQHESSLATMLQRAFAIRLDKSLQRTDWMRRPLPPAMIAYAARDAEVTLALYYWLKEHYSAILQLHENTGDLDPVASWITPFLYGNAPYPLDVALATAKAQGLIQHKSQIYEECRKALTIVTHPMRKSRLLRLITDLSLVQLAPDIIPLLQAATSDERAGSARALGRLNIKSALSAISPLLHDPVYDVRKAAQTALQHLENKEPQQRATSTRAADGTRSWVVETTNQPVEDEHGWKARLRSMIDQ